MTISSAPVGRAETVVLVQALRGMAAVLVLVGHVQEQLSSAGLKAGIEPPLRLVWPGGFGVDLFFCISGFIMVVTSAGLAGRPGAAGQFLARRAIRLVPLYWIATLLYLAVLGAGSRGLPDQPMTALLTSLLFVPFPATGLHDGLVYPLLSLGWSLNYEVLFYLLFASALMLPVGRVVGAAWLWLLVLVGAGLWLRPETQALRFWTQPIVLEFGAGMLLGLAWLQGRRLTAPMALLLAAAALAWLAWDPMGLAHHPPGASTPNDGIRLLGWGLPAAALLGAATGFERGQRERVHQWPLASLVRLGDWSYALYLFHPFALIGLTRLWLKLDTELRPGLPALGIALAAGAVLAAALVHWGIDQPLTRGLNRLWRERKPWPALRPPPGKSLP